MLKNNFKVEMPHSVFNLTTEMKKVGIMSDKNLQLHYSGFLNENKIIWHSSSYFPCNISAWYSLHVVAVVNEAVIAEKKNCGNKFSNYNSSMNFSNFMFVF